jgi:hypothetical protein
MAARFPEKFVSFMVVKLLGCTKAPLPKSTVKYLCGGRSPDDMPATALMEADEYPQKVEIILNE